MDTEYESQPEAGENSTNNSQSGSQSSSQQSDTEATGSSRPEKDVPLSDELFEELTVLGNRFLEVVQAAWNSEDRKQIQNDLKEGLTSVAASLEEGFQKVMDNEQAKEVIGKADEAAESVGDKLRSSEAVNDLGEGLVKGLSLLAAKLEKWTEEMTTTETEVNVDANTPTSDSATDSDAQDIPIDKG